MSNVECQTRLDYVAILVFFGRAGAGIFCLKFKIFEAPSRCPLYLLPASLRCACKRMPLPSLTRYLIHHSPSITHHPSFTIHHSPFTIHHSQFFILNSSFTIHQKNCFSPFAFCFYDFTTKISTFGVTKITFLYQQTN